jgi:choline dehydrogenase-like flavoprotein
MLIDGRNVANGTELSTGVCIVGAGPAGISLGCAFSGKGFDVTILESGGLHAEPETQALAAGEIGGIGYVPLESARLRAFGGATGLWGGWCRPFDEIDFEERSWVPHSGWPIKKADLDPYYEQAQELCELGPFDYDPANWDLNATPPLPLPDAEIRTRLVQFSKPTRFGVRYRSPILSSSNVRLLIHSNVVQLEPYENSQIKRLRVTTLEGNHFTVKARIYVLAAGGIENARLLLASNEMISAGIGNEHDVVGRYYADHMQLDTAAVFPLRQDVPFNLYLGEDRSTMRQPHVAGGMPVAVMGYLTLSAELQKAEQILNYSCKIPRTSLGDYYLHTQSQCITRAPIRRKMAERLRTLLDSASDAMSISCRRAFGKEHTFYKIVTTQEQAPNPSSRVMLGGSKDRLGVPVARLQWELTDLDRHTLKVAVARLRSAFAASGVARLNVPIDLEDPQWPSNIGCSWHHCGMTRMHHDPKRGVVDANSCVHGVHNLYLAGSSVFTTNGHGNPTLTVVALTLRLADRISQVMAA